MYEFKRYYKLFNTQSIMPQQPNFANYMTGGAIPAFDQLASQVSTHMAEWSSFKTSIKSDLQYLHFGMSLLHHERWVLPDTPDFRTFMTNAKFPIFTSKETALQFLVDVTRFIYPSTSDYVEFSNDHVTNRLPEELSIVKHTKQEIFDLSKTEVLIVNPYVPGFMN